MLQLLMSCMQAWYDSDGNNPPLFTERVFSNRTINRPNHVHLVDLDQDGDMDVLCAAYLDNEFIWWESDGNRPPGFTERIIGSNFLRANTIMATDMDNDSDFDIITTSDSAITWFENNGNQGWTSQLISASQDKPEAIFIADINSDGNNDLVVVSSSDDTLVWYESDGLDPIGFSAHYVYSDSGDGHVSSPQDGPVTVSVGDIDGDLRVDIVVGSARDLTLAWYKNEEDHNGDIIFSKYVISDTETIKHVRISDMDADGDMDVVIANDDQPPELAWFENDGSLTLPSFRRHSIYVTTEEDWILLGIDVVDIDRDGDLDVVASSFTNDDLIWIENKICPQGTYWVANGTSHVCIPCSPGSYQDQLGQSFCKQCSSGSYQDLSGQSACIQCPAGTAKGVESSNTPCSSCARGMYSVAGASICSNCPIGTYSDMEGSAFCLSCPSSRISAVGSDDIGDCVNPVPNFAIAIVVLALVFLFAFPYVIIGRFHRASFLRIYRVLRPLQGVAAEINVQLTKLIFLYADADAIPEGFGSRFRPILVLCFLVFSTMIIIPVAMMLYLFTLSTVLYRAMLVWRGLYRFTEKIDHFYDRMEAVSVAFAEMTGLTELRHVIYPFIVAIDFIAGINIDFGAVEVTCEGSQAPLELLINTFVLGFAVIVIESDFHVYTAHVFGELNHKVARTLFHFNLRLKGKGQYRLALACIIVSFILELSPLTKLLQFCLSLLTFGVFVEKNYAAHQSTTACDDAGKEYGVPGIDSIIANVSSTVAWLYLFPTIYTLSRILVPSGSNLPSKFRRALLQQEYRNPDKSTKCTTVPPNDQNVSFMGDVPSEIPQSELDNSADPSSISCLRSASIAFYYNVLRLFSIISPDLIIGDFMLRWIHYLCARLRVNSSYHFPTPLLSPYRCSKKKEDQEWIRISQSRMPSYFELSEMVHDEMTRAAVKFAQCEEESYLCKLIHRVSSVSSYFIFCHLFTEVGAVHWFVVFEKYIIFIFVSFGVWNDRCVDSYDLENETKKKIDEFNEFNDTNDPNHEFRAIMQYKIHRQATVHSFWKENQERQIEQNFCCFICSKNHQIPTAHHVDYLKEWHRLPPKEQRRYINESRRNVSKADLGDNEHSGISSRPILLISNGVAQITREMIDRLSKHELAWDDIIIDFRYDDDDDDDDDDGVETDEIFLEGNENNSSLYSKNGGDDEYTTFTQFVISRMSEWNIFYPQIRMTNVKRPSLVRADSLQGPNDPEVVDVDNQKEIDIEVKEDEDTQVTERQEENHELINNLIGPRTLLWLIIPQLAIVSVFANTCVGSPPFLLTKKVEKYFAPLIIKNIVAKARELELAEGNHINSAEKRRVKWTLYLKAISFCSENSRAVRIVQNYFEFSLTIGVLYGAVDFWLAISFIIMVPIMFFRLLDIYVIIGKKMRIHDYDFWWMFYFVDPQYYKDLVGQMEIER